MWEEEAREARVVVLFYFVSFFGKKRRSVLVRFRKIFLTIAVDF
jgi:hypothetical protein